MNKKRILIFSIAFIIIISVVILIATQLKENETPDPLQAILGAVNAKLEYRNGLDDDYVIIESDIYGFKTTLADIAVVPVEKINFDDDWIYRISFNWNQLKRNDKTIILIGRDSMKVDDTIYIAEDGVEFGSVVEYVANVYNYHKEN